MAATAAEVSVGSGQVVGRGRAPPSAGEARKNWPIELSELRGPM